MSFPIYSYAWLIPCFPLLSAFIISISLLSFRRSTNLIRSFFGIFSICTIAIAFCYSAVIFWQQWQGDESYRFLFKWIFNPDFSLDLGFVIDPMSSLMLVIVTSIAFLVMVYSDTYMSHDQGYVRFFAYLSIFSTSMLGLVLSPNLVQLYIFWELVGMCSYLLVGFWYTRPTAADAAQKAFLANRVGDFGFLLGILGFYWLTGSFDFEDISLQLITLSQTDTNSFLLGLLFSLLILMGPLSKSAQFPLHVWLPDAMEGPTPISALIHAATMVAAGIFLVARMFPIFDQYPFIMQIIAWVGGLTAVLGATVALTQTDLKKGLAYSTVSQLGYMMMALGVGSPTASLFHLMTHAFSKALLFLGSGSVILAMEEVVGLNPAQAQNMQLMGGLRTYMPITSFTFLLGTLSLCGFPPFACFWSKDQILENIFSFNIGLWVIAWLTAGLTSFYMFRLYFLTFEGKFRAHQVTFGNFGTVGLSSPVSTFGTEGALKKEDTELAFTKQPKESPFNIILCLIVLAIPTCFIGFLGTPFNNIFQSFLEGSVVEVPIGNTFTSEGDLLAQSANELSSLNEFALFAGSSIGISLIGFTLASLIYSQHKLLSTTPWGPINFKTGLFNNLNTFFGKKWYIDELYNIAFVQTSRQLSITILKIDQLFIDAFINVAAAITLAFGQFLRFIQIGQVQLSFFFILIAFLLFSFRLF